MDFVLTAQINEASSDVVICPEDHRSIRITDKLNYGKFLQSSAKTTPNPQKWRFYKVFLRTHFKRSLVIFIKFADTY